jgi:hypothetical protein
MTTRKIFITLVAFLLTSALSGQNLTFETIEKSAGQYYTSIGAALLSENFDFLGYDNSTKKLTYQYLAADNSTPGNKFCYIWRSDDDTAKTITYFTTDHQEYVNWKKAIFNKNYKSKPLVDEGTTTKEWFYSKKYGVKIVKKQLDNAEKNGKIIAYLLTIVKLK